MIAAKIDQSILFIGVPRFQIHLIFISFAPELIFHDNPAKKITRESFDGYSRVIALYEQAFFTLHD